MTSSAGSSPLWSLSDPGHESLSAYTELQEMALKTIGDTTLTDDALMERAQQHLQVLGSPEKFAKYNMP